MAFIAERLPAALPFFEREIGRLSRPTAKGWALGRCPFHRSKSGKSFSVHISGRFHCWGCDAKGPDLIKFIQLRDHCNFRQACMTLGCWADVTPAEQLQLDEARRQREHARQLEAEQKEIEHQERIQLRDQIHSWLRVHFAAADRLGELHAGAGAHYENEAEDLWQVMALSHENARSAEQEYLQCCGFDEEKL